MVESHSTHQYPTELQAGVVESKILVSELPISLVGLLGSRGENLAAKFDSELMIDATRGLVIASVNSAIAKRSGLHFTGKPAIAELAAEAIVGQIVATELITEEAATCLVVLVPDCSSDPSMKESAALILGVIEEVSFAEELREP